MALGCNVVCFAPADDLIGPLIVGITSLAFVIPPVKRQCSEVQKRREAFLICSVALRCATLVQLEDVAAEQKLMPLLLDLHSKAVLKRFSIRSGKFQCRITLAVLFNTGISLIEALVSLLLGGKQRPRKCRRSRTKSCRF